jgi:hypothetical protein
MQTKYLSQIETMQKQSVKDLARLEEKKLREISKLRASESVIIKEQVMIADERVLQMRQEMTMSIKELTLQCSVYLEKIQRKDAEYRKLMMQLAELKEWRLKYDEIKRRHASEIEKLMREIERLKVELVEH